jgi:hypothetical protein
VQYRRLKVKALSFQNESQRDFVNHLHPHEIPMSFIIQRRRFWKMPQVSGFGPAQEFISYRSVIFLSIIDYLRIDISQGIVSWGK